MHKGTMIQNRSAC